jgi:hypothetical protein
LKRRFEIADLKGVNIMGRKIEIDEKERLKKHMLLDKLMDGCYIEPITKSFYCKKCDCIVTIDWIKNEEMPMQDM